MEIECPVCMEELYGKTYVTLHCCAKEICLDCYVKWGTDHPSCPLCRNENGRIIPEPVVETVIKFKETARTLGLIIVLAGLVVFFTFGLLLVTR